MKLSNGSRKPKRSYPSPGTKACEMLIAIDEPLFNYYNSSLDAVTELAERMVHELNVIYQSTVFMGPEFGDLYFQLKEVRVVFELCPHCSLTHKAFLQKFSRTNFADFCLAHLFTLTDFAGGIQGLAWKGTLCKPKLNTGFTTFLNFGVISKFQGSVMAFAHEIGHNLGADHDELTRCRNHNDIMSETGTLTENPQFSSCSIEVMHKKLRSLTSGGSKWSNCLQWAPQQQRSLSPSLSICGNGIIEAEEECDCGLTYEVCSDPCCYPGYIPEWEMRNNKSAIPCRTNLSEICKNPFRPLWLFGIIVPWTFMLTVALLIMVALRLDWNKDRLFYGHAPDQGCQGEKVRERKPPPVLRQHSLGMIFSAFKIPRIRQSRRIVPLRPPQPRGESVRKMVENMERFSV